MGGYIGSSVGNLANAAERKQTYSITTATTSLTGLAYTPTKVHVFHNGVRLVDGTDYTATNGTSITLTNAAQNGDEVVVISYPSFQTSDTVSAANGGTFAGNVTMSSDLNVDTIKNTSGTTAININSNGVVTTPAKPMFKAKGGSNISLANNTWTKAAFNSESFDIGSYYDPSTNYRYTPLVAGKYFFYAKAYITWASAATEQIDIAFYKNGSLETQYGRYDAQTDGNYGHVGISSLIDMNGSSDYIEVYVRASTSTDAKLYINGEHGEFSGYLVS